MTHDSLLDKGGVPEVVFFEEECLLKRVEPSWQPEVFAVREEREESLVKRLLPNVSFVFFIR